jgi:energy-coupling factor transporter transmembrane protein EcfT
MIPAANLAWRPVTLLPLQGVHPAARLGLGLLAVVSALLLPAPALVPLAVLLGWLLVRAGWRRAHLGATLRSWSWLAAVVLAAHTLSATDIAPLGHPSWIGLGRGALALGRLALMLTATGLLIRLLPLTDLTAALAWWLRPLRPLGVDTRHLGVTLAVALNTAPRTRAEAARLAACLRLRRADGRPRRRGLHLRERLMVVPPLMEGLARQAESLPLALAGRFPATPPRPAPLPWPQGLLLAAWTALVIWAA